MPDLLRAKGSVGAPDDANAAFLHSLALVSSVAALPSFTTGLLVTCQTASFLLTCCGSLLYRGEACCGKGAVECRSVFLLLVLPLPLMLLFPCKILFLVSLSRLPFLSTSFSSLLIRFYAFTELILLLLLSLFVLLLMLLLLLTWLLLLSLFAFTASLDRFPMTGAARMLSAYTAIFAEWVLWEVDVCWLLL